MPYIQRVRADGMIEAVWQDEVMFDPFNWAGHNVVVQNAAPQVAVDFPPPPREEELRLEDTQLKLLPGDKVIITKIPNYLRQYRNPRFNIGDRLTVDHYLKDGNSLFVVVTVAEKSIYFLEDEVVKYEGIKRPLPSWF